MQAVPTTQYPMHHRCAGRHKTIPLFLHITESIRSLILQHKVLDSATVSIRSLGTFADLDRSKT